MPRCACGGSSRTAGSVEKPATRVPFVLRPWSDRVVDDQLPVGDLVTFLGEVARGQGRRGLAVERGELMSRLPRRARGTPCRGRSARPRRPGRRRRRRRSRRRPRCRATRAAWSSGPWSAGPARAWATCRLGKYHIWNSAMTTMRAPNISSRRSRMATLSTKPPRLNAPPRRAAAAWDRGPSAPPWPR